MEQISRVPEDTRSRVLRPIGGSICSLHRERPVINQKDVHFSVVSTSRAPPGANPHIEAHGSRINQHGGQHSDARRSPSNQGTSDRADTHGATAIESASMVDVEDGLAMGRCSAVDTGELLGGKRERTHRSIHVDESEQSDGLHTVIPRPHLGHTIDGAASEVHLATSSGSEHNAGDPRPVCQDNPDKIPLVDCSLVQEGSERLFGKNGRRGKARQETTAANSKACRQGKRFPGKHDPIFIGKRKVRENSRNRESYRSPLAKLATITIARKASKVANALDEKRFECHFPQVDCLDMTALTKRMNGTTRKRFEEVWRLTNFFEPQKFELKNPMRCPAKDAELAVKNGIAVPLPKDTAVTCNAFSVLETKTNPTRTRRRPIQWAKGFNDMCDNVGYKAQVDLKHHSAYFARCNNEAGATFDLKAGFFQVPLESDKLFTFKDVEGNVFGLRRLPMGICTAPEIMQIITSTIAGDPLAVQPKFATKALVDVWIDNVLFSGTVERVDAAVERFRSAVQSVKATINWNDSTQDTDELDFIGMHFSFKAHTVGLAQKNRDKIRDMNFAQTMLMSDLESFTSRLMYASSVVGVQLSSFYFALKFMRRRLSEINRETISRNDTIRVPPSALKAFSRWKERILAQESRPIPSPNGRKSFTLWTDASRVGWGAVLIDNNTQQTWVVASRWSKTELQMHINVLEAIAVEKALQRFTEIDGAAIFPRIDNTSVVHSVRKGYSKSEELNEVIRRVQEICVKRKILFAAPQYVRSADNLADSWSRGFTGEQVENERMGWTGGEKLPTRPSSSLPLFSLPNTCDSSS